MRYPSEYRGLDQMESIRISTINGPVPISSFVSREAKPKVSSIQRVDGARLSMSGQTRRRALLPTTNCRRSLHGWLTIRRLMVFFTVQGC